MRSDIIKDLVPYYHVRNCAPCNLNCFYCYERPHPRIEPAKLLADIEANLRTAAQFGYRVVAFGAGELLLVSGWERALAAARQLGFAEIYLVTNLTMLDARVIERFVTAGGTAIMGTIFSSSDAEAAQVSGAGNVFSRQLEALRQAATWREVTVRIHLILTARVVNDPLGVLACVRDRTGTNMDWVLVSAIEPIGQSAAHPLYTHALDVNWPDLIERADREGMRFVVQNVPACILGRYAHRGFFVRQRVGRLLDGWPLEPEARLFVNLVEGLYRRRPLLGRCVGCQLSAVCHRNFEYPRTADAGSLCDEDVVLRLLDEQVTEADTHELVSGLRFLSNRGAPDELPFCIAGVPQR